jgi:hypothetical protein
MHIFGCLVSVLNLEKELKDKLKPRGKMGRFLGYPEGTTGYKVLLETGRVIISSDVIFYDDTVLTYNASIFQGGPPAKDNLPEIIPTRSRPPLNQKVLSGPPAAEENTAACYPNLSFLDKAEIDEESEYSDTVQVISDPTEPNPVKDVQENSLQDQGNSLEDSGRPSADCPLPSSPSHAVSHTSFDPITVPTGIEPVTPKETEQDQNEKAGGEREEDRRQEWRQGGR